MSKHRKMRRRCARQLSSKSTGTRERWQIADAVVDVAPIVVYQQRLPTPPTVARIHVPRDPFARQRPGELLARVIRCYGLRCCWCGTKVVVVARECHPNFATVEHVKPRSLGGTSEMRNLRPACKPCNNRRGSKPVAPRY